MLYGIPSFVTLYLKQRIKTFHNAIFVEIYFSLSPTVADLYINTNRDREQLPLV